MRVLVVDDEPDVEVMLRAAAEVAGVEVIGACSDPNEALRLARELRPDGIVVDHHLGDIEVGRPEREFRFSTFQAIEILRSMPVPSVIAVFSNNAGVGKAAINAGAHLFVLKSEGPAELYRQMTDIAERRAAG